jgi:rare lipoprotein A
MEMIHKNRIATLLFMACSVAASAAELPATANEPRSEASASLAPNREPVIAKPKLDVSGRKRIGVASFYAKMFAGRMMADGTRMDPHADNAASKTLPLGTTAKVTNLQTGDSAVVTIKDRGPYVRGRIVDLTPSTARKIGLSQNKGIAKVEVTPITVPLPDGGVKVGEALRVASLQRPAYCLN